MSCGTAFLAADQTKQNVKFMFFFHFFVLFHFVFLLLVLLLILIVLDFCFLAILDYSGLNFGYFSLAIVFKEKL